MDKQLLVKSLKRYGYSVARVSRRLGTSCSATGKKIKSLGIPIRPKFCLHTRDEMRTIALTYRIGDEACLDLHVDHRALKAAFDLHDVEYPWYMKSRHKLRDIDDEELHEQLRFGITSAARRYGVGKNMVLAELDRRGIELDGKFVIVDTPDNEIRRIYESGFGVKAIARVLEINLQVVYRRLRAMNVKMREFKPRTGHPRGAGGRYVELHVPIQTQGLTDSAHATEPRYG